MISTLETELNTVAYSAVKREVYPPSPAPVSDAELKDELKNLKAGKIPRPKTKAEYVALLSSLETQIAAVQAQNEKAQADYRAARETIDKTFEAAIQTAKTDEDNRWAAIRAYRNALLSACDWTQIPDVPLEEKQRAAWQDYRQALRDIPQQLGDGKPAGQDEVVWPEKPESP
jgi:membrane-bound lytic murein transglycosylase